MYKTVSVLFFASLMLAFVSFSASAQSQEDLQKLVANVQETAKRTAIYENNKLKSLSLPIPGEGEMNFTFEWAASGNSFTLISEDNERIQIFYNEKNQIQSMVFPDGSTATLNWATIDGVDIVDDATIGTGDGAISVFEDNLGPSNECAQAVRAARDAIIAAGITCTVDPGPGCWAAVGYAGYMTYRARQACR